MKKFLFIMALLAAISCRQTQPVATASVVKVDTVRDTVYIPTFDYAMKDSMIDEMNRLKDSLFIERYKVNSVRYYLNICKRKPSQVKFLVGWINRAIK